MPRLAAVVSPSDSASSARLKAIATSRLTANTRRQQRHAGPAQEAGGAQQEGLHRAHDVRHPEHHQRRERAEHHADDHAGQQQAQRVLHALGQRQRDQHRHHRAGEAPRR